MNAVTRLVRGPNKRVMGGSAASLFTKQTSFEEPVRFRHGGRVVIRKKAKASESDCLLSPRSCVTGGPVRGKKEE